LLVDDTDLIGALILARITFFRSPFVILFLESTGLTVKPFRELSIKNGSLIDWQLVENRVVSEQAFERLDNV
jgi:hypothetical protein